MLQLTFRVRRDHRRLPQLSREHPGSRFVAWCNLKNDIVEVQARDAAVAAAAAGALARDHGAKLLGAAADGLARNLVVPCGTEPRTSLSLCVEQHGGIVLPPIVVEAGWETFRIALFEEERLPAFLHALDGFGPHEVLRKRRTEQPFIQEEFMLSTAELFGGLTRKQSEALLAALHGGYYAVPRSATMVEIAQRRGQPRTTMEEHVRKAEAKLLTAMGPFLALRVHDRPRAPRRRGVRPRPPPARRARGRAER